MGLCGNFTHDINFLENVPLQLVRNARTQRCVYNKRVPLYGNDDYGLTLSNRWLQVIAILIFKAVNGVLPEYISNLFVVRNNVKDLRGTNKLVVPRKNTTTFGLKSTGQTWFDATLVYRITVNECNQRSYNSYTQHSNTPV